MTITTRRAALSIFTLAAVTTAMGVAPRLRSGGAEPHSTSAALTWTADLHGNYTWDYASTVAAPNHGEWVEGVWYDDWRLPTAQEVINAVNGGTYGFAGGPGGIKYQYTNVKKGNWVTVVKFTRDANGYPVPGSAVVDKVWKTSALSIKFVRP